MFAVNFRDADDYDREVEKADHLDFKDDTWSGFTKSFNDIEAESLKEGLNSGGLEASINQRALINEIADSTSKFSVEAILGT